MRYLFLRFTDHRWLLLRVVVQVLYKLLFVIVPANSARFIDAAIARDAGGLWRYGTLELLYFALGILIYVADDFIKGWMEGKSLVAFARELRRKTARLSREREETEEGFGLLLNQYYDMVRGFFYEMPMEIGFSVFHLALLLWMMLRMNVFLGCFVAAFVPLGVFLSMCFGGRVSRAAERLQEENDTVKAYLYDSYRLRHQERGSSQLEGFEDSLRRYTRARLVKERAEAVVHNIFLYGSMNFLIIGVGLLSGYMVFKGRITAGMMTAFGLYVSQAWSPMEYLVGARAHVLSSKPAIAIFRAFLETPELPLEEAEIFEVQLVDFQACDGEGNPLHAPLNQTFRRGGAYVLCGPNGSGKTTLVESLLGITARYRGEIRINGAPAGEAVRTDALYIPGQAVISRVGALAHSANGSFGEKKRSQIEFYLGDRAGLVIVDEPTNFLDAENKKRVMSALHADPARILLVVTNDPEVMALPHWSRVELGAYGKPQAAKN